MRTDLVLLIISFLIMERVKTQSGWTYMDEASQVHNTIMHKYDFRVRPSPNPKSNPAPPVPIDLDIKLIHLKKFDIENQEIQTVLDFYVSWTDGRLLWNPNQVKNIITNTSIIWTPDITFINAIEDPKLIGKSMGTVYSDGKITTTKRYLVTTFCGTFVESDVQQCYITLGSLMLSDNHLKFQNLSVGLCDDFSNHKWDVRTVQLLQQAINQTEIYTRIHMTLGIEKIVPPTTNATGHSDNVRLDTDSAQRGFAPTLTCWVSLCSVIFVSVMGW